MIGLSVSFCIGDIIRGVANEADVEKLVCSLEVSKDSDLDCVIANYRKNYWYQNPDEAERIFRRFWGEGRIDQPRLKTGLSPNIKNGHWVATEEEIRWLDSLGEEVP